MLLDKGKYELRLKTDRFLEYVGPVEVVGRDKQQKVTVELIPGWADITINTEPAGAEIVFADSVLGVTPASVELLAGLNEIVLRKAGVQNHACACKCRRW